MTNKPEITRRIGEIISNIGFAIATLDLPADASVKVSFARERLTEIATELSMTNKPENQAERHSKEPWRADCDYISDSQDILVARITGKNAAVDDANAARIVQCVNACRGVKDPESAISDIRSLIEAHHSELQSLRQQLAEAQKENGLHKATAENYASGIRILGQEKEDLRAELAKEKQRILFDQDAAEKLSKCAAEVEVLRKEIATNKAAREWIAVADRTPELNQAVLCYHGGRTKPMIDVREWRYADVFVTHWRELPEPPPELRALVKQEEKK